jgi:uncharacterized protein with PQ loop repeat
MDLTSLGLDVATIAGIIGIVQTIKIFLEKNKKLAFLKDYILLFVIGIGIIAGIGLSFKDFPQDLNAFKIASIIFKNCIMYAGGSVLFHQLYKSFLEKKAE